MSEQQQIQVLKVPMLHSAKVESTILPKCQKGKGLKLRGDIGGKCKSSKTSFGTFFFDTSFLVPHIQTLLR